MRLETSWFLIVIFPFVLGSTWAALLLWDEGVKRLFPRLVIYSILAAGLQTHSYYHLPIELLRFCGEIVSGFLLLWIISGKTWSWTARILATSYIFGTFFTSIAAALVVVIFDVPYNQLVNVVEPAWLVITLPSNALPVVVAWMIRRSWLPGLTFFYELKEKSRENPSLVVALGIQTIIFIGMVSQLYLNQGSGSLIASAVNYAGLILLCGLGMFILVQYMRISRQEISLTQDVAAENIVEMLQTVRGQRHDFLNHLQVIHGLCRLHDYKTLDEYLSDLVDDSSRYEVLLQIDNPVIAALIHAKIAQAQSLGIELRANVQASLAPLAPKALDVGRILGNLIDNALESVQTDGAQWVELNIFAEEGWLHCAVTNPYRGDGGDLQDIFTAGISGKPAHSGLGLFIARKLAAKLRGRLEVARGVDQELTFTLLLPYPAG
jgi:signal transduction histidine kinase